LGYPRKMTGPAPDTQLPPFASRPPAPCLSPYVERYLGYRMLGTEPGTHRGLPSRHPTFIVSIGRPVEVARQTDPRQAPATYGALLSGLQATPALIAHDGNQEGVAIELAPAGFRALFATPMAELWDATVPLEDVISSAGHELWERLQSADSWEARFAACDDVLARRLGDQRIERPLAGAWELLIRSGGRMPVDRVAREVGWSRQNLTRRFRAEFGLGPKLAAKVIRFDRARLMLEDPEPFDSVGAVAAACGYFDQAHLNRDFADLAGVSPGRFRAEIETVPKVQDPERAAA
jgi:AraC-like DNA-binding protein